MYSIDKNKLPSKNEASWLYSITKNETINFLKKRNTNINIEDIYENANNHNKTKRINNKELDRYHTDYDLYYYGIDEVKITINNKTMLLQEALKSGNITLDGLIIKANKDIPNARMYRDGGSMEYHYDDYTIIKMHKLDGNRDVYIGTKDMTINDVN